MMCSYGTIIVYRLFRGEVQDRQLYEVTFFDRVSGSEFKATTWVVLQYLFHQYTYESGVLAVMAVMSIALTGFLGYHIYITCLGMTTNEHVKWGQVKKWHEKEVKKYQAYLEKQKEHTPQSTTASTESNNNKEVAHQSRPVIGDGDVTCTGGTADPSVDSNDNDPNSAKDSAQESEMVMEDPGPMPKNIYNRGLVENWKEVFFPMSLQRKAAAGFGGNASQSEQPVKDKPKAT